MNTMTPFTESETNRLLNFLGYGHLTAPVWFLGIEEAGGGEKNLRRRLTLDVVEDRAEAHAKLETVQYEKANKIVQTWRGMCCIMLELEGKEIKTESIRDYQMNQLGRRSGNTFVGELLPIPKPKANDWSYRKLFPSFPDLETYQRHVTAW